MPTPFSWTLGSSSSEGADVSAAAGDSLYGLALVRTGLIDGYLGAIPPGDLALTEDVAGTGGELLFTDGIEQARQECECRARFFLGEYFLDTRQGVPYFRDVLIKNPNRDAVKSVFRRTFLSVPGIVSVPRIEYTLDVIERRASIGWEGRFIDGRAIHATGAESLQLILSEREQT